jgi:hypothetical protein
VLRLHSIGAVGVREECIKSATPERPHAALLPGSNSCGHPGVSWNAPRDLGARLHRKEDEMLETQMAPPLIILVRCAEATRRRQRAGRSMVPNPARLPTSTHRPKLLHKGIGRRSAA